MWAKRQTSLGPFFRLVRIPLLLWWRWPFLKGIVSKKEKKKYLRPRRRTTSHGPLSSSGSSSRGAQIWSRSSRLCPVGHWQRCPWSSTKMTSESMIIWWRQAEIKRDNVWLLKPLAALAEFEIRRLSLPIPWPPLLDCTTKGNDDRCRFQVSYSVFYYI